MFLVYVTVRLCVDIKKNLLAFNCVWVSVYSFVSCGDLSVCVCCMSVWKQYTAVHTVYICYLSRKSACDFAYLCVYVLYRLVCRDVSKHLHLGVYSICVHSQYMILPCNVHYHTYTHFLHSNWDSLVQRISANNSWVICAPCWPLAFLFNLLSPTACSLINNTHRHVC